MLKRFNPSVQRYCAANVDRCFTADVPTLREVQRQYSAATADAWLDIQLTDLIRFCGVKGKEEFTHVMDVLVAVIADNFGDMKLSELMLFFNWFKAGRFGRFYGTVDAMVITDGLQQFRAVKSEYLRQIQRKQERDEERRRYAERERQARNGELLTAEEWKQKRNFFEK